jgi:hypothetical protein
MSFLVIPQSGNIEAIQARTLKDAIGKRHGLLSMTGIDSVIHDRMENIVEEKEQSSHIFHYLCS